MTSSPPGDSPSSTPRSGRRQRRSGLSRLAEARGFIPSPQPSTSDLRSNLADEEEEEKKKEEEEEKENGEMKEKEEERKKVKEDEISLSSPHLPPPAPKPRQKRRRQQNHQQDDRQDDQQRSGSLRPSLSLDRLNCWSVDRGGEASENGGGDEKDGGGDGGGGVEFDPVDKIGGGEMKSKLSRQYQSSLSLNNIDAGSNSSLNSTTSSMRRLATQDVRRKGFLHGSFSAAGALGAEQLDSLVQDRRIQVMAVTWNMASAKSYPSTLESLLLPEDVEHVADIYSVSLQETTDNYKEFLIRCQETLGMHHVLFEFCRNRALMLAVFIRRDLLWFVSIPDCAAVTTRAAVATKGCAAVSFTLFGTSMLFICSHFKADDTNFEKRLSDYEKIITKLDLPRFTKPTCQSADVTQRFDVTIWSGDLNFRVQAGNGDRERVNRLLRRGSAAERMVAADELKSAQAEGRIFENFLEGDIRFPPTYKYDIGSDHFDTSDKQRIPSYTDRILLRYRRPGTATIERYNSVTDIRCSDHRPVYAVIGVTLRPGVDNIPLAHGRFCRWAYTEGCRRRANRFDSLSDSGKGRRGGGGGGKRDASSQVCSVM